ncbi:MAG: hypothetical protein U9N59_01490 [Campylobacterota bacterium]|nr:hypothetical protein [Campylobacterota bacterium]
MKKVLLGSVLTATLLLAGNNAKDKIEEPTTKLEKIRDIKGSILVKGYQEIGAMRGKYSHSLKVLIYEFNNKKSKVKTHGLSIEVDTGEKYNNEASSFVDYEEIPSLLKGLEFIGKINDNPTKLKNYEASYKTNGGVKITNFNSRSGNLVAVQVGKYSPKSAYFQPKELINLKKIISDSYKKLKKLKGKK